MPELPEVQTIVNDLNGADIIGKNIKAARVYWQRTIAEPSPRLFCRRLKAQHFIGIGRRGKYLVFNVSDGRTMLLHLRMFRRKLRATNMNTLFSASRTAGNYVFTIPANLAACT